MEEATEEEKSPDLSEDSNEAVNDKSVPKPTLNSNSYGDSKKVADLSEKPRQVRSRPIGSYLLPRPLLWPASPAFCSSHS